MNFVDSRHQTQLANGKQEEFQESYRDENVEKRVDKRCDAQKKDGNIGVQDGHLRKCNEVDFDGRRRRLTGFILSDKEENLENANAKKDDRKRHGIVI